MRGVEGTARPRRARRLILFSAALLLSSGEQPLAEAQGGASARGSGVQITPDGKRTLISKDVGAERWAITRNDDGTVTGNVSFADGGDPVFIFCEEAGASATELMLSCQSADRCLQAPCAKTAWTFLADVTLPREFFEPPSPPVVPKTPLGLRRFSIDPATSYVRTFTGVAGPAQITGFEGFIDIDAGKPDPTTGIALLTVVGASPVIAVAGEIAGVGPSVTCIVPQPGQFPVANAGVIDCNGGTDLGYGLVIDHDIGAVGVGGFTAQDCADAGGTVEGPTKPHSGVCNGTYHTSQFGEDTGVGGLILAPNLIVPNAGGFNVRISTESALPCGDEDVPFFDVALVLTTARTTTTILDERDLAGQVLESGSFTGENFSCVDWTEENGPGAVVFTGFALDYELATFPGFFFDAIAIYYLKD